MSWLFWVLLVLVVICMIQGFRKGLVRTIVSMVFFVIVIMAASWINPYVGDFIREKTDWQEKLEEQCSDLISRKLESQMELSVGSQVSFIEELPLPQLMKEKLIENNNTEIYQQLAVKNFADYLSGYLAYGIMNGITFLASFIITIIIVRMLLYAIDILTELPVIGTLNRTGGMLLGAIQGILWIWILFLLITLLYDTAPGMYLMEIIKGDPVLTWIYDRNYLTQIIMGILI